MDKSVSTCSFAFTDPPDNRDERAGFRDGKHFAGSAGTADGAW